MNAALGAGAVAAGAVLVLAGHAAKRRERNRRLGGRLPDRGAERRASNAIRLGVTLLALWILAILGCN